MQKEDYGTDSQRIKTSRGADYGTGNQSIEHSRDAMDLVNSTDAGAYHSDVRVDAIQGPIVQIG